MIQGFNKDVKSLMNFNNPAIPHKGLVHNQETDTTKPHGLQKIYRSGVGSILYLVNNSQPE